MVRPTYFQFNPETAVTNRYQQDLRVDRPAEDAEREFQCLVLALREAGVEVLVAESRSDVPTPDAVFPNNWVSFHQGGRAILYPMAAASRRAEVRPSLVDQLGYRVFLDLTDYADRGKYLEGTGSLVFDRQNGIAYACRSPRTDGGLALAACSALGYNVVEFDAVDLGAPVYHTNVLMAVGERTAVVCFEAMTEPESVRITLTGTGKQLLAIDRSQMHRFAGNMLQLRNRSGELIWVLSRSAYSALEPYQRDTLEKTDRLSPPT